MKTRILSLAVVLLFVACNGGETISVDGQLTAENDTGITVTEVTGTTTSVLGDYNKSSFSSLVYLHKTEDKILLDYNFFPEGTDVDQQAGTAAIPCDSTASPDDKLAAGMSVPTQNGECAPTVITLSKGNFNNDGIAFPLGSGLTIFESLYAFRITATGFLDAQNNMSLSLDATSADLEAVHAALLAQRAHQ